jgi:hypothetical protein
MNLAEMPPFQRSGHAAQLRAMFVQRLKRLIRVRRDYDEDLNSLGAELIDRAIYATYRDCVDYGASDEALKLMTTRDERRK